MKIKEVIFGLNQLDELTKLLFKEIENQNIVVFKGALGAGKTSLIKNICNFLGVNDEVSSPTFAIVNEYRTSQEQPVFHFDCYRLKTEEEALDLGIEEYLDSDHLCLIEWPEQIENLLPEKLVEVSIVPHGEKRKYTLKIIN